MVLPLSNPSVLSGLRHVKTELQYIDRLPLPFSLSPWWSSPMFRFNLIFLLNIFLLRFYVVVRFYSFLELSGFRWIILLIYFQKYSAFGEQPCHAGMAQFLKMWARNPIKKEILQSYSRVSLCIFEWSDFLLWCWGWLSRMCAQNGAHYIIFH